MLPGHGTFSYPQEPHACDGSAALMNFSEAHHVQRCGVSKPKIEEVEAHESLLLLTSPTNIHILCCLLFNTNPSPIYQDPFNRRGASQMESFLGHPD